MALTREAERAGARQLGDGTGASADATAARAAGFLRRGECKRRPARHDGTIGGLRLKWRQNIKTVAHEQVLPTIDQERREELGSELQSTLVELIDLSLIGKQLHWNIVGRPFKPLHEHLDELVDSWRTLADTVAERAVALGVAPDGRTATVASGSTIAGVEGGSLDTDAALHELVPRLADVGGRMRARIEPTSLATSSSTPMAATRC